MLNKLKKTAVPAVFAAALVLAAACSSTPRPAPPPEPTPEQPKEMPKTEPKAAPVKEEPKMKSVSVSDYTTRRGDTLSEIGARFYGKDNAYYFPFIMVMNSVITHPDEIEVGTALKIPDFNEFKSDAALCAEAKKAFDKVAGIYEAKNKFVLVKRIRRLAQTF